MGDVQLWHWLAFGGFVIAMLLLDLGVFHRENRETSLREAGFWTAVWTTLALSFNGLIWYWAGAKPAAEFLTGYLIEWSLSMDNVFVFAVLFGYFKVPTKYQHRVLFWGIMGAIFMRLSFVLAGAALIHRFNWIIVGFGLFLIYTGVKLARHKDDGHDPEHSLPLRIARRFLRVAKGEHGSDFFVRQEGKLFATPLFLVLVVVEITDVIFAFDSVPAIFGITKDPFIVFTSNIFAILGLRALYFLLAGVMNMFRYLPLGLAGILIFVGVKMTLKWVDEQNWLDYHLWPLPDLASLGAVLGILMVSIVASIAANRREKRQAA